MSLNDTGVANTGSSNIHTLKVVNTMPTFQYIKETVERYMQNMCEADNKADVNFFFGMAGGTISFSHYTEASEKEQDELMTELNEVYSEHYQRTSKHEYASDELKVKDVFNDGFNAGKSFALLERMGSADKQV